MGRPKSNTKSKLTQSCAETAQSQRINHARKTITRKDNEINNDDDISDENDESFLRNLSKDQQNPLCGCQEQERNLQQNPPRGHQEQERDLQQNPLHGHQEQERDLQQNPLCGRQEQERDLQQNPLCGRQKQERDLQQNPLCSRQDEIENRERVKRRRNEREKDDDDDDNYSDTNLGVDRRISVRISKRGTTVSEVEINDFISRDVIIKRIFNRYFTAVDVSEIPEITMNKLIEFSKECFNIAWEGRDETNTRVFYDQIKTLDKNTEVLEIPSRNTGDKREDNNDDAKKVKKIKKGTDVKTFTMNVDTSLIQLMKSGGVLHVRSASDSTSTLETKANEVSIPYNFSQIGSDNRKVGDLGIKVEYFNKPVKLLNTAAELVAKDLYQLLQYSDRLPDNLPSRDNLIFKHFEEYRNRLIEYLSSINHKDEFSTFKGAISIDLNKMESTSSDTIIIDEADATGNDFGFLEEQTYSLKSLLSVNKEERNIKLKEAIKNLSSRVWYSINSLVKDTISQEVV
ncbi:hypothetical protein GLOIN_2v1781472 [Rhizophagus clarus]|uniref:Uncharacterized protein n=1 Tax=Rhizophagus clarus TaxID=94130 RepID=A0A8H3QYX9_9GLOM|nr:hypothetical protein GLOIN_2v1781472 [Rhizophagus clarus]